MSVMIPVSVGELFDKITILQIKLQKITDISKLKNIKKEYDFLVEIASKIDANFLENSDYQKLLEINSELWVVEDSKRNHEANKDFGEIFIFWARKVYMKNDERAKVKREINELYGSEIIEEKSYKSY